MDLVTGPTERGHWTTSELTGDDDQNGTKNLDRSMYSDRKK